MNPACLRYRLRHFSTLFALATSSPLAASFGAHATNHFRLQTSAMSSPTLSSARSIPGRRSSSSIGVATDPNHETIAVTESMTPVSKLDALRKKMKELSLDCYVIPTDDPHLSGESIHSVVFSRPEIDKYEGISKR